jgi:tRNA A37 threonylcarbamoyladenosine synthetase subunit TsaC/SUA5/YrdC
LTWGFDIIRTFYKELWNEKPMILLMAGTGFLGLRISLYDVIWDLINKLKHPVTVTNCNLLGGHDSYSVDDVAAQFSTSTLSPDILIDVGRLRRTRPSTVVKISNNNPILRIDPIRKKQNLATAGVFK